jgi:hypothetical protein
MVGQPTGGANAPALPAAGNAAVYYDTTLGKIMISYGGATWVPLSSNQTPWLQNINANTFTLTNVGSIGIGTATPVSALHAVGAITAQVASGYGFQLSTNNWQVDYAGNMSQVASAQTAVGWLSLTNQSGPPAVSTGFAKLYATTTQVLMSINGSSTWVPLGGSQTPWLQNVDANTYSLSNATQIGFTNSHYFWAFGSYIVRLTNPSVDQYLIVHPSVEHKGCYIFVENGPDYNNSAYLGMNIYGSSASLNTFSHGTPPSGHVTDLFLGGGDTNLTAIRLGFNNTAAVTITSANVMTVAGGAGTGVVANAFTAGATAGTAFQAYNSGVAKWSVDSSGNMSQVGTAQTVVGWLALANQGGPPPVGSGYSYLYATATQVLLSINGSSTWIPIGGSQTPWIQNINANTYNLSNVGFLDAGSGLASIKLATWFNGSTAYGIGVAGGQLTFGANIAPSNGPPGMVLTSGGLVGIGTTSPVSALHAVGAITAQVASGYGFQLSTNSWQVDYAGNMSQVGTAKTVAGWMVLTNQSGPPAVGLGYAALYSDTSGVYMSVNGSSTWIKLGAGSTPGGTSGQVQYNSGSNTFAADANFTYGAGAVHIAGGSSGYYLADRSSGAISCLYRDGGITRLYNDSAGDVITYDTTPIIKLNGTTYIYGTGAVAPTFNSSATSGNSFMCTNFNVTYNGFIGLCTGVRANLNGDSYGQFRALSTNYGFIIRNDDANTYFLLTRSGDPYGIWSDPVRPLTINNASGNVSTSQNLSVGGALSAGSISVSGAFGAGSFTATAGSGNAFQTNNLSFSTDFAGNLSITRQLSPLWVAMQNTSAPGVGGNYCYMYANSAGLYYNLSGSNGTWRTVGSVTGAVTSDSAAAYTVDSSGRIVLSFINSNGAITCGAVTSSGSIKGANFIASGGQVGATQTVGASNVGTAFHFINGLFTQADAPGFAQITTGPINFFDTGGTGHGWSLWFQGGYLSAANQF